MPATTPPHRMARFVEGREVFAWRGNYFFCDTYDRIGLFSFTDVVSVNTPAPAIPGDEGEPWHIGYVGEDGVEVRRVYNPIRENFSYINMLGTRAISSGLRVTRRLLPGPGHEGDDYDPRYENGERITYLGQEFIYSSIRGVWEQVETPELRESNRVANLARYRAGLMRSSEIEALSYPDLGFRTITTRSMGLPRRYRWNRDSGRYEVAVSRAAVKVSPPEENVLFEKEVCPCETCKLARFEGSKISGAVVHSYSDQPAGGWKPKQIRNDPFSYYLGVELETDNHYGFGRATRSIYGEIEREFNKVSEFTNEQAADMRQPKQLWFPKHDGSVTGPEFASHPATMAYWRAKKDDIANMFQMLLHAGFRSHDNDACGMHINISRNAFDNRRHLFRFLTLLHSNTGWSLRMSQRTKSSVGSWANMETFKDKKFRKQAAHDLTQKNRAGDIETHVNVTNKYTAFNAPYGQPRFEFRLPRGTLRIDRFFKNLEWTVAMIEYTRKGLVTECRPKEFMAWVMKNVEEYPNLANFLVEKKMVGEGALTVV
jgi:hypothetical protein